jgi:hypothetical protein
MLVCLDAVPPEQSIEAFPFDTRMGCRLSDLPIVAAQDFFEVSACDLATALLLRVRPRQRAQAGIRNA